MSEKSNRRGLLTGLLPAAAVALLVLAGCREDNPAELPRISTLPVTEITSSDASGGGNVTYSGSAPVTSRGIVRDTLPEPSIEKHSGITMNGEGTGPFISLMTGLSPATDYYVRAYAVNIIGTVYGEEITFTTEGGMASVTTSDVTNVAATSATAGGNVTSDGGSEVTDRGVIWHDQETMTINENTGTTSDGAGTGSFTSVVGGLEAGTRYYLVAYATNGNGTAYGNPQEFETSEKSASVTDADGNEYPTAVIGNQVWMSENLRTTRYADGTLIDNNPGNGQWQENTTGSYSVYPESINGLDSQEEVLEAYGALYNWYAVQNESQLCPAGWEVPTDEDWTELTAYLAGEYGLPNDADDAEGAGNALKSCLQVSSPLGEGCDTELHPRWNSDELHYGTDDFGFAALPGSRRHQDGSFGLTGAGGYWWTTSQADDGAWYRAIFADKGSVERNSGPASAGMAVRCIKKQ